MVAWLGAVQAQDYAGAKWAVGQRVQGPNRELDCHVIDEEFHTFVNEQQSEFDTYLYGRRLYEVMRYWETADQDPSLPAHESEFARIWQKLPKIVFSATLEQV